MGRRRRKVVKIVRRTLPELYLCPQCGKNTVKATINKKKVRAVVICSNCSLSKAFEYTPQMAEVDAYCRYVDDFYGQGVREEPAVG